MPGFDRPLLLGFGLMFLVATFLFIAGKPNGPAAAFARPIWQFWTRSRAPGPIPGEESPWSNEQAWLAGLLEGVQRLQAATVSQVL